MPEGEWTMAPRLLPETVDYPWVDLVGCGTGRATGAPQGWQFATVGTDEPSTPRRFRCRSDLRHVHQPDRGRP
ncbi:hypothetical protein ACFFX0_26130 [Citricoccus parietis]|uniref:Uncharacterized protein n=1 Tax=Citricoccus parietis TaxID=592307 RepID=A0ABV5G694_9MICC